MAPPAHPEPLPILHSPSSSHPRKAMRQEHQPQSLLSCTFTLVASSAPIPLIVHPHPCVMNPRGQLEGVAPLGNARECGRWLLCAATAVDAQEGVCPTEETGLHFQPAGHGTRLARHGTRLARYYVAAARHRDLKECHAHALGPRLKEWHAHAVCPSLETAVQSLWITPATALPEWLKGVRRMCAQQPALISCCW